MPPIIDLYTIGLYAAYYCFVYYRPIIALYTIGLYAAYYCFVYYRPIIALYTIGLYAAYYCFVYYRPIIALSINARRQTAAPLHVIRISLIISIGMFCLT